MLYQLSYASMTGQKRPLGRISPSDPFLISGTILYDTTTAIGVQRPRHWCSLHQLLMLAQSWLIVMLSEPRPPASPVLACRGGRAKHPYCHRGPVGSRYAPPRIGIPHFVRNDNRDWERASAAVVKLHYRRSTDSQTKPPHVVTCNRHSM